MTHEQQRLETQSAVVSWTNWFMTQNQIPASLMEDALNKAILSLKDQVVQEFIQAVTAETAVNEQEPKEEEASGD
nr:MAG TPA: hypothetical protein [Caudoviricetes sp.]